MALTLYESYEDNLDNQDGLNTTYRRAQTFTPSTTHFLKRIELKLYRIGTVTDVIIEIRSTTGGEPDGTDAAYGSALASATTDCSGITTNTTGEWVAFDFDPAIELIAGTIYAICVYSATATINWKADATASAYAGGKKYLYSGGNWVNYDTQDYAFRDYGTADFEGILVVQGDGSVLLSYEVSSVVGAVGVIGVCSVLLSHELPLIIRGDCVALLSYEFYKTIEWPEERPDDESITDKEWDEETGTWVDTTGGPGRHKNSVIAIGQGDANEGVIYFGDM